MRKITNKEKIEGRLYEHSLAVKQVQKVDSENFGKDFIGGTIDIATDEECLNVVSVHFSYVAPLTKAGKKNDTFYVLKTIIDSGKTILSDGRDNATLVKVDTALGLNDFFTSKNGEEELVSAKRNEGGFVSIVSKLSDESVRNTFECDMLINKTKLVEVNEERHIDEEYLVVEGAVFNFRNEILPVQFVVKNAGGIKYFESLDASPQNLVFTKVWGKIVSETVKYSKEEESAFGEPVIKEYERKNKNWVITGTAKEVYEIEDSVNGITNAEIAKAIADREIYLADVKRKSDEYQATKAAGAAPAQAAGVTAVAGGFNF